MDQWIFCWKGECYYYFPDVHALRDFRPPTLEAYSLGRVSVGWLALLFILIIMAIKECRRNHGLEVCVQLLGTKSGWLVVKPTWAMITNTQQATYLSKSQLDRD